MKRHLPGLVTLLVASLVLGILVGEVFFGLFEKTVPPAVITTFNAGAAHAAFLAYGLGAGIVLFLWGVLAAVGSRLLRRGSGSSGP